MVGTLSLCPPYETAASAAAFRKHSRHKQSSPFTGIGSLAVSSAHQQSPDTSQPNSVPHREQARRRGAGCAIAISFGFVMIYVEALPSFSCRVHLPPRYIKRRAKTMEADGKARRTNRWPAIPKPLSLR
jgi:hypothetical protein